MAAVDAAIAGRYELIRPLSRGSFAQTLLARETSTGRLVALKALHPRSVRDWKNHELFDREAATLRALRHHGVPEVFESFHAPWDGSETSFLAMEYIEGQSLADIIAARRHLDPAEVLHLFLEMLGVLEYLHTRLPPVLHRDVKPSNVIVRPDGSPVLVDFGSVRNVFRSADESGSTIAGTYGYMPYEQHMGQATPASDLYALAATFLHLITGRTPPELLSDAGRLEVPEGLSCGEPLRAVLEKLLAPGPVDRYQSARAVRSALLGAATSAAAGHRDGREALSRYPDGREALSRHPDGREPLTRHPDGREATGGPGLPALPPSPRRLDSAAAANILERVGHSPWRLMASNEKPGTPWGVMDVLLVGFFSLVTVGILPATFYTISKSRRRRLKQFIVAGTPATARVLDMSTEDVAFEVKMTRVKYEFEVDGQMLRDSDQVLPSIAHRWDRGTPIQILYLADEEYDSVIISTA